MEVDHRLPPERFKWVKDSIPLIEKEAMNSALITHNLVQCLHADGVKDKNSYPYSSVTDRGSTLGSFEQGDNYEHLDLEIKDFKSISREYELNNQLIECEATFEADVDYETWRDGDGTRSWSEVEIKSIGGYFQARIYTIKSSDLLIKSHYGFNFNKFLFLYLERAYDGVVTQSFLQEVARKVTSKYVRKPVSDFISGNINLDQLLNEEMTTWLKNCAYVEGDKTLQIPEHLIATQEEVDKFKQYLIDKFNLFMYEETLEYKKLLKEYQSGKALSDKLVESRRLELIKLPANEMNNFDSFEYLIKEARETLEDLTEGLNIASHKIDINPPSYDDDGFIDAKIKILKSEGEYVMLKVASRLAHLIYKSAVEDKKVSTTFVPDTVLKAMADYKYKPTNSKIMTRRFFESVQNLAQE
jgi:hypothetical protein